MLKPNTSFIVPNDMDVECIELCKTLNAIPGVETFESCCGHLKQRFMVFFECNDFFQLSRLSRAVNKNYSDGMWEILVDDCDGHPIYNFWLRSIEPFKTTQEMNKSLSELIENIKYWQDSAFDNYFNNNGDC